MPEPAKLVEFEKPPIRERAVVVRLALPHDYHEEVEESLAEMKRLAQTAGADVLCEIVQRRPAPCPATLIGAGKVEEIRVICDELDVGLVLFDSDLTPAQAAKLEKCLERKIVDRTQLILDIFALHADTNEGKHQVELAQLRYLLPRLTGRGSIMRQQGGIGVRGPGEQKLEVDRRVIKDHIRRLERELEAIRNTRRVQRKNRLENSVGTVALVGYTNAGKSSLLNAMSGADVLVADKLFATLDPRSRKCRLPSRRECILTDTVGFIRKLPHTLVAAFRATLEEVTAADLLLIVADAAHPAAEEQLRAVYEVLHEINAADKPALIVLNKIDIADPVRLQYLRNKLGETAAVSARTGEGIEALVRLIDERLASTRSRVSLRIPQSDAGLVAAVYQNGRVLSQRYENNTILLDAEVGATLAHRLAPYRLDLGECPAV